MSLYAGGGTGVAKPVAGGHVRTAAKREHHALHEVVAHRARVKGVLLVATATEACRLEHGRVMPVAWVHVGCGRTDADHVALGDAEGADGCGLRHLAHEQDERRVQTQHLRRVAATPETSGGEA
eukprot:7386503-Prymnesium_polylepis.2